MNSYDKKKINKALILAAGEGKRLVNITERIPKPMIKLNKRNILEHNIIMCKKFGIKEIFINVHYLSDLIVNNIGNGRKFNVKIFYNFEKELMGTAGAIIGFKKLLKNESFFIIYGDNYYKVDLNNIFNFHKMKKSLFTIQAHWKKDCSQSGRLEINNSDILTGIFEKENLIHPKSGYVNGGIYLIENVNLINGLIKKGSDFALDIIPKLIEKNDIYIHRSSEKIYPIDNLELLKKASQKFN